MRHLLMVSACAVALLVTSAALVSPAAASAAPCVGTGTLYTSTGLANAPMFKANVDYIYELDCADGSTLAGSGTFTSAACGHLEGFPGAYAVPTATTPPGNYCANGTATAFIIHTHA